MLLTLPTRLTAFTYTVDAVGRVLMVRHERLAVVTWELPGGDWCVPTDTRVRIPARHRGTFRR
jgi:hypothetical protein